MFEAVKPGAGQEEALSGAIDMVCELFLMDPNTPETSKVELRILRKIKELDGLIRKCTDYAHPQTDRKRLEQLYPLRREVLEYLTLVAAGMEAFLSEHPMPEREK